MATTTTNLTYTYEANNVCMTIYPYDNYKIVGIYKYSADGVNTPYEIDRSSYYKYYLEFGDSTVSSYNVKKVVTIEEYTDYTTASGDSITLESNQLLFRIPQKQAIEILNLSSNKFNVIRKLVSNDGTGENVIETQSIFQGKWATSEDRTSTDQSTLIKALEERVTDLLDQNDSLNARLLELVQENADLQNENADLQNYVQYKEMYEDLVNQNAVDAENTYTGTAINYDAKYITVNIDDETLANQVNASLAQLQDTTQD
jgi:regulator of replication initiation timing